MPNVNKTSDGFIGAASTLIKTSLSPTYGMGSSPRTKGLLNSDKMVEVYFSGIFMSILEVPIS